MPGPTPPQPDPTPRGGATLSPWAVATLLTALFVLVVLGLILTQRVPSRVFYDQALYHRPTIDQFAAQWPDLDFWHYLSATTPGYHLLMAAVVKFVSPSVLALQLTSLAIAACLIWALAFGVAARTAPLRALGACLPFMFSKYVVESGAWLLPDDMGWLGVVAILLIALRPRPTARLMVLGGLVLLGVVFVRQIHAWTAGLLWASAWLLPQAPTSPAMSVKQLMVGDVRKQVPSALAGIACTLPGLALLGLFVRFWGGPVPPVFQGWYHAVRPGAAVQMLALLGLWGLFFIGFWWPHLVGFWRTSPRLLLGILALAAIAGLIVPTNDFEAARHTGVWGLAERFPTFGHTSPVMLGLLVLGVVPIAAYLSACRARQRIILLAAFAGYAAACTANSDLFQRYFDPFILMMLALMTAEADAASARPEPPGLARWRRWAPLAAPALVAAFFLQLSLRSVLGTSVTGVPASARIGDPPPPAYDPAKDTEVPPCAKPRPPKPPDRHFWPWN